ncbi:MAG: DUF3160 domain-containing protein [Candidatus Hodarchaeota archaeon]
MAPDGNFRKYGLFFSVVGSIIVIAGFSVAMVFLNPLNMIMTPDLPDTPHVPDSPVEPEKPDEPEDNIPTPPETAIEREITNALRTNFGYYSPQKLSFEPQIPLVQTQSNLTNVNFQGLTLSAAEIDQLERYGFVLVDEGYEDIYDIYDSIFDDSPKFITTDLCLHAYHVLYDISLRVLEGRYFASDFQIMLNTLRTDQLILKGIVTEDVVSDCLAKNIAYLSVMLYLLDNTTLIPNEVETLVNTELANIKAGVCAPSAIFGYEEDYTQYKVRGHYTRNAILSAYFKAIMYAGRMGFLLQESGIQHTRMALLLLSSFNTTLSSGKETVWDIWDRIYQPTVFYVGACDDLTPVEYYQIWQGIGAPEEDQLANNTLIETFITLAKNYRKPNINSMIIGDIFEAEGITQGFRLMGQRFIPDSYIFQQLVYDKLPTRFMPKGLDVFSVLGSPRAAFHLQDENQIYLGYDDRISELCKEFANFTDYDWTQNLYWLWLYTLFPLLHPAVEGFPAFMLSDAWSDKALMTAMASWAELRHDTILYAKQSFTVNSMPQIRKGYVEPYPTVYARLGSLVRFMQHGLEDRDLIVEGFSHKLASIADLFDHLAEITIKELENEPLNDSDYEFIHFCGNFISNLANYKDPAADRWVSEVDDRMAIIADVHTDPDSGQVLEVGTGDPFVIYVVVQDYNGSLRLTRGGTFSYYEFEYPMNNRLTDEQWHQILDSDPPPLHEWIQRLFLAQIIKYSNFIHCSRREEILLKQKENKVSSNRRIPLN